MARARLTLTEQLLEIRSDLLGPARTRLMADAARAARDRAQAQNRAALGFTPQERQFVDGREGAALESVKAGGVIRFEFAVQVGVVKYVQEALRLLSPVLTGQYRDSHRFLINGEEASWDTVPSLDDTLTFVNMLPYARKIERSRTGEGVTTRPGQSKQAPNGVYEVVAVMVQKKYGRIVNTKFSYGAFFGGSDRNAEQRQPFIRVWPKRERLR